ncbi:MAG TPA: sulfurtransferase TusA family protein [Candidatus Deferrimicrobium sp.]|nr:sulfurtransferase TusA family protein [Candidatus Deferrimicrobium sp.]
MLDTTASPAATTATPRTIDARGSFCPGPLMELIRAIRESQVGDVLAVLSSDNGSRSDIPKWIEKAGHRLIGVTAHEGYDEIVVEKMR